MSTFNKTQQSIRRKAKLLNTPENYFKLKKFIEDDSNRKNDEIVQFKHKSDYFKEQQITLSDEKSSDDDLTTASSERPGNAQFVDLPRVELVDFTGVSSDGLFGSRREVYRLKAHKLEGLVDCHLCKLIFDYTKICKHYS